MTIELANAYAFPWAVFGATGVTGRMVLERALARGHRPTLIGRDTNALARLAQPTGLRFVVASLDDGAALARALAGHKAVLNVAGPFGRTAPPLIAAALAEGVDYVDLNGEIPALRDLLDAREAARDRGVVLVGAAGFGVAATDGLALAVAEALGGVDRLQVAVAADSGHGSPAVAESTLAAIMGGGYEVAGHRLVRARLARRRWIERGPDGMAVAVASAPLAELVAACHVTGAAEIVAGVPMPAVQARALSLAAPLLPTLARIPPIRRRMATAGGHAGSADVRAHASRVWVSGTRGTRTASAFLEGGEGYALAADIAVAALETMAKDRPKPGAHTPASAFGSGFIARVPGVQVTLRSA